MKVFCVVFVLVFLAGFPCLANLPAEAAPLVAEKPAKGMDDAELARKIAARLRALIATEDGMTVEHGCDANACSVSITPVPAE